MGHEISFPNVLTLSIECGRHPTACAVEIWGGSPPTPSPLFPLVQGDVSLNCIYDILLHLTREKYLRTWGEGGEGQSL